MNNPLVSIIIPSFNQGKFIRKTLDSCLQQDYRPIEILVIDGGSTDETVSILREFDATPEVRWISESDEGVVDAVNKGFQLAQGDICAIQSSDDYYLPGTVWKAVQALLDDAQIGLVYADYVKVDIEGREIFRSAVAPYSLLGLLLTETWISQSTAFFRLALARKLGGWDARIPYVPDTDLWFRMAFVTKIKKIDELWSCAHTHGEQRNTRVSAICRDYATMLEQMAELKRVPRRFRRAARAGLYRIRAKYGDFPSNAAFTLSMWKAILLCPELLFTSNFPLHRLVPGYFGLSRLAGNMKRQFRFHGR